MNYEKFGIVATVVILAVVLATSGIAQNTDINYDFQFNPNGAQTKSIDDIKTENLADRLKILNEYCEKIQIDC